VFGWSFYETPKLVLLAAFSRFSDYIFHMTKMIIASIDEKDNPFFFDTIRHSVKVVNTPDFIA
jgi:hypothetical protein